MNSHLIKICEKRTENEKHQSVREQFIQDGGKNKECPQKKNKQKKIIGACF